MQSSSESTPVIGIPPCLGHADPDRELYGGRPLLYLERSVATWLVRAGARPYLMGIAPDHVYRDAPLSLDDMLDGLDGLLLHGGADMAPESYGETPHRPEWSGDRDRDRYELTLVRRSLERTLPIFGVCRGMQVINVARGGTLIQDIETELEEAACHRDEHDGPSLHSIRLNSDARLSELYGGRRQALVNSVHHQAVDDLGEGLTVEARCEQDGIVEALRDRSSDSTYIAGIQWHPEFQDLEDDRLLDPMPVLEDFISACRSDTSPSS